MQLIRREMVEGTRTLGRFVQNAVGKDAFAKSGKMTMGFVRLSAEGGVMRPHRHAEELCYVLASDRGTVRYGPAEDRLGEPVLVEPGMILHVGEDDWHVFEYGEVGYLDMLFFYGQVDIVRTDDVGPAATSR